MSDLSVEGLTETINTFINEIPHAARLYPDVWAEDLAKTILGVEDEEPKKP